MEILEKLKLQFEHGLFLLGRDNDEFRQLFSSIKSELEQQLNLEDKYQEMYRLLEVMETQKGVDLKS
jgi:hypothetical protein